MHQYSQLFADLHAVRDVFDPEANAALATRADRAYCVARAKMSATFRAGFWGLSGSDGPQGYAAHGPDHDDGTVCPGCVAASAPFEPAPVLPALRAWAHGPFSARIWGTYGFSDALNLDQGWVDEDVIGITVGAAFLGLADADPRTSLTPIFSAIPAIARGMALAGTAGGVIERGAHRNP